jgi:ethanolamine utilization protein EutQ (cupin superfamily)
VTHRELITAERVSAEHERGGRRLFAPRGSTVVTPGAWSKALELGVEIIQDGEPPQAAKITAVRSAAVKLERFAGAGASRNVQLADVITAQHGSPMTAGFMAWAKEDSFPWTLTYDEIDYVLEGVLQIQTGGRTVEAQAGDVVHIPKGSEIIFGTPSRVRVFYVTYPANWSG